LPKAEDIIQILALVAVGFAARWVYTAQLQRIEEEHTVTIVWAVIWSAILGAVFQAIGRPLPDFIASHFKDAKSVNAAVQISNILWAALLGLAVGRIQVARISFHRERQLQFICGFRACLGHVFKQLFSLRPEYRATTDYFLNRLAHKRFIIITTKSDLTFLGWALINDCADTDDYHLILHEPRPIDPKTNKYTAEPAWESLMFKIDEIQMIALVKRPPPDKPAPLQAESTPTPN